LFKKVILIIIVEVLKTVSYSLIIMALYFLNIDNNNSSQDHFYFSTIVIITLIYIGTSTV